MSFYLNGRQERIKRTASKVADLVSFLGGLAFAIYLLFSIFVLFILSRHEEYMLTSLLYKQQEKLSPSKIYKQVQRDGYESSLFLSGGLPLPS